MKSFGCDDLAKDLKDLDFDQEGLPMQRSLGLYWDLNTDSYTFLVSTDRVGHSRRNVLSLVNSIFDPLGFAAPVTLQGKLFLRSFLSGTIDWDEPLPKDCISDWESWRDSLSDLRHLKVPRTYSTVSYSKAVKKQVHIFCDASEKAIAAVAYLVSTTEDQTRQVGFLLGKTKVAPSHGHTIPRLELCAAVLAVEIAEIITHQLGLSLEDVQYYSDSRIVLGYINNKTRRFYVYVSNRVERILRVSRPNQWSYVTTDHNPADHGTRCLPAAELQNSAWLHGPPHLHKAQECLNSEYPLMDPDEDNEIRPPVRSMKSKVHDGSTLGSKRFERFSSWKGLVEAIAFLKHKLAMRKKGGCESTTVLEPRTAEAFKHAESFIIRTVQNELFGNELLCLREGVRIPKNSKLLNLNPFIDTSGILRVGGRLKKGPMSESERNPIILPGDNYISTLLILHYHDLVKHQGRHFTEGAVRAAGLWITGSKRLIASVIHKCVKCRKLRGRQMLQQMADLPADRLEPGPPFTSVGVDTFGPWHIVTRRTRGGQANSKRWAVIFTCLTTRAVHIEVVEELSSSSFINALRRFVAIRGKVTTFRSDRGTNFIGATDILKVDTINVEDGPVKDFLYQSGTVWIFNPPHSSHMGGVWERMIGVARKVLDALLLDNKGASLTHEVLVTFMAEVSAIMNSRPLVPVSTDPESPQVLSPSMLLTQKCESGMHPLADFDCKNMLKAQWQRVQALADMFWTRWKQEYIPTLQTRRKWQHEERNLKAGDIVLLKDDQSCRNDWPIGLVINAIKSDDGNVRKAEIRVIREGKANVYTRPLSELVHLISE